jgi:hypothetical protein
MSDGSFHQRGVESLSPLHHLEFYSYLIARGKLGRQEGIGFSQEPAYVLVLSRK